MRADGIGQDFGEGGVSGRKFLAAPGEGGRQDMTVGVYYHRWAGSSESIDEDSPIMLSDVRNPRYSFNR